MPSVVFWNAARGRQGAALEEIATALYVLIENKDPDLCIVSEAQKGTGKNLAQKLPLGYRILKRIKDQATYFDTNTLRYVLVGKITVPDAHLIESSFEPNNAVMLSGGPTSLRPGVAVKVGQVGVVAIHAYSHPANPNTQIQQIINICLNSQHVLGGYPNLVIGDLNIKGNNIADRNRTLNGIRLALGQTVAYQALVPNVSTHKRGNTLDWALVNGLQAKIEVVGDETPEFDATNLHGSGDFHPAFEHVKSDHKPIVVTW
jgi:hypothetical protein